MADAWGFAPAAPPPRKRRRGRARSRPRGDAYHEALDVGLWPPTCNRGRRNALAGSTADSNLVKMAVRVHAMRQDTFPVYGKDDLTKLRIKRLLRANVSAPAVGG